MQRASYSGNRARALKIWFAPSWLPTSNITDQSCSGAFFSCFIFVICFCYRRWKSDPGYRAWKDTKTLIGRRVAKRVDFSATRQGGEGGKCLDILSHGLRRGYVVGKEFMGNDEVFTVRFPRNGSLPEETEVSPPLLRLGGFHACFAGVCP